MRENRSLRLWLEIAITCVVVAVLGFLPYPLAVRQGFRDARAAIDAGNSAQAVKSLGKVVELQPWRNDLWQSLGVNALKASDPAAAIIALENARQARTITAEGLVALGNAYLQTGDPTNAARAWKAAINVGGPADEAFQKIYLQQRAQGDLIAAQITLTQWLSRNPNSVDALYEHGLLLTVLEPDKALPVLLDAAQRDAALSNAVETLRKGLNLALTSGDPIMARLQVGRSLGTLGEWDLARVCFEEATQLDPNFADGWAFLGEARQQSGQDGAADLQQAAKLAPDSVVVQALFSVYYRRQGQPERALDYLEKIIEQEPEQALWQLEMANTLAESGDLMAAEIHYRKAVELEPGSAVYWVELARYSIVHEADVRGIGLPAAREALQLAPKDASVLDLNGQVMYYLGDMASAERFLQRALEIDAANAAAHLHLGQVYLQWERLDQAQIHLQTAERLAPNTTIALTARRLLDRYFFSATPPAP
ncbi:MAG TPA: tetratricopeptide repeat protein [Anaerolineaceae bacterium]